TGHFVPPRVTDQTPQLEVLPDWLQFSTSLAVQLRLKLPWQLVQSRDARYSGRLRHHPSNVPREWRHVSLISLRAWRDHQRRCPSRYHPRVDSNDRVPADRERCTGNHCCRETASGLPTRLL